MKTKVLITGATGQDGHYLSELLLEKGYEVYGLVRRTSQTPTIPEGIIPVEGDMIDAAGLNNIVREICPNEIYNLAAQSHVGESFKTPYSTMLINAGGALALLEAARSLNNGVKFYQASTSELFGTSLPPQDELSDFHPRSPYSVAKLAAYYYVVNYREAYDMFACNGILFNHESPLRGDNFVTQKICRGIVDILTGQEEYITLGNLDAKRDWGHAKDYVYGMWLMMQDEIPRDYVLATGEMHSIRDFLELAFRIVGITHWEKYIKQDERFMRPSEVPELCGKPTRAERTLGWKREYNFETLVLEMMESAMKDVGYIQ